MSRASSQLTAAVRRIDDHWDAQRTERTLAGVHRKRRRRSWQRRGVAALALALVMAAFTAQRMWGSGSPTPIVARAPAVGGGERPHTTADEARARAEAVAARAVPTVPTPHMSEGDARAAASTQTRSRRANDAAASRAQPASNTRLHMQLEDGSEVTLHDEHTQLTVAEVTHRRAVLDMRAGRARFDVVHRAERTFIVRCGEVTVEVLGTAFELERDGARTHVTVLRGRVAVSWSTGRTELTAGDAAWFPRGEPSLPPAQRARDAADSAPQTPVASAWREPAERGEFERAYELLRHAPQPVGDDVEQLLLAADTARLSGHPEAALPYLRRVVAQHARDSRAPLAAFTLGGVLMQQLGQPREAEAAYARARELASDSPLAEDALARQVEAAHRAGDAARARTLAREYLAKYPQGRRVHAVQRFAGL